MESFYFVLKCWWKIFSGYVYSLWPALEWPPVYIFSENSDSPEVHILSGGSKFQIARSQLLDSGTYTCIASNIEGKAQKSYILSIQGKSYECSGQNWLVIFEYDAVSVLETLR